MQVKSVYSKDLDGYDAGFEIGEALQLLKPEIIILHCSIHYRDFKDLFDGLYDGLETRDFQVIGATGDGYYHTEDVGTHGVSAMGINSDHQVTWNLSIESHVGEDSYKAARKCIQNVCRYGGEDPNLALLFYDGISGDGTKIVEGVGSVIEIPILGGASGDDRQFKEGYVFMNGAAYQDSIVILGISGAIEFAISSRSGWKPVGEANIVEQVSGKKIQRIGGVTALEFVEKQLGYSVREVDPRLFPLAIYDSHQNFFIREFIAWDHDSGEITLAAKIKEGDLVRITHGTFSDVIGAVDQVLNDIQNASFEPVGAFVISCAARKWILSHQINEERERLFKLLKRKIPVVGYASFGEIGPIRNGFNSSYSKNYFHNETYVLCIFGIKS